MDQFCRFAGARTHQSSASTGVQRVQHSATFLTHSDSVWKSSRLVSIESDVPKRRRCIRMTKIVHLDAKESKHFVMSVDTAKMLAALPQDDLMSKECEE